MTIMALVLVGILQMFSVSLVINKGAAARTQMLFKCQQVVENIRWYYYVTSHSIAHPSAVVTMPVLDVAAMPITGTLPYVSTDTDWGFWGPDGANVMERPSGGPYKINYVIDFDVAEQVFTITVSAVPTDVAGATQYFGARVGSGKRVDYVAQFTP